MGDFNKNIAEQFILLFHPVIHKKVKKHDDSDSDYEDDSDDEETAPVDIGPPHQIYVKDDETGAKRG